MTRRDGRIVAKSQQLRDKAVLFVDIDGVVSLWGFPSNDRPEGAFHNVDGVMHFPFVRGRKPPAPPPLPLRARLVQRLEEKADEHLPYALSLPRGLPVLSFERIRATAGAA